jgi:hypothetical protein
MTVRRGSLRNPVLLLRARRAESSMSKLTAVITDVMGSAGARCSGRWSKGPPIRWSWPTGREASCAGSCPNCGAPSKAAFGLTMRFSSNRTWKIDFLDEMLDRLTAEIARRFGPVRTDTGRPGHHSRH